MSEIQDAIDYFEQENTNFRVDESQCGGKLPPWIETIIHNNDLAITALRRLEDKELDLCRRKLERIEAECKIWVSNDLAYEIRKILKSS